MNYKDLWHRLEPLYGQREAVAIVRRLLEDLYGMTLTDIVSGRVGELTAEQQTQVEALMRRLEKGEPLQYVVGRAQFCGRWFAVNPSVLIPRPETEELCRRIVAENSRPFCGLQPPKALRILDIGTGSGCIAITLALDIPYSEVSAWDISAEALLTARGNARRLGARVNFEFHDVLDVSSLPGRRFDIIVSNPPYICDKERKDMERNVLDYEPSTALFVPDDDPLRFYRAILGYAQTALSERGKLLFECNPLYIGELADMAGKMNFGSQTLADQFGKQRFLVLSFFTKALNI